MKAGDRALDRFTVLRECPAEDRVQRFRARTDDGEEIELLQLRATSDVDSAAEARFAAFHRSLGQQHAPGVLRIRAVVTGPDGRTVVVRDATDDATLADITPGRLSSPSVAAIGAAVGEALLAVGGLIEGPFLARDVALDAAGLPVLAPRGRPVVYDLESRRHVAPEVASGGTAERVSALFGLGVILHKLATGRDPVLPPGGTAPPASSWNPAVQPTLDDAIGRLLSPDPAARPGALPLLQRSAGALTDLRLDVGRAQGLEPVRYTTVSGARRSGGQPDRREDTIGAVIAVTATDLAALDPRGRSAAAGWGGVAESELRAKIDSGDLLVIEVHERPANAQARADELRTTTGLPLTVLHAWASTPKRASGCLVAGLTAFPGVAALVVGLALWPPALVPAGLLAIASAVAAAMALGVSNDAFSEAVAAVEAHRRAADSADVRRVRARIASLRKRIHLDTLPEVACADLRDDLRALEEQLDALAQVASIADKTLATADLAAQRARLARLTAESTARPDLAPERDHAARVVADLEDITTRRQRALDEIARMVDALDRLEGSFATAALAEHVAENVQALDQLAKRTRLAREALADSEPPTPRKRELE